MLHGTRLRDCTLNMAKYGEMRSPMIVETWFTENNDKLPSNLFYRLIMREMRSQKTPWLM